MTINGETAVNTKQIKTKPQSFWHDLFRRLMREKPLAVFGLVIAIVLLLTGIFANFLAPYGMNQVQLSARLSPPSITHILGTDQLGRDVLSRLIYGARISMIIGLSATVISESIATILGIISGYFGGTADLLIQRFVDVWMSLPSFLMLMTIMSIVGNGMFQIIIVLGITAGITHSRIIRSAVVSIKSNTYVSSAEAIGCSPFRMMVRHILPNVMSVIIVGFTICVGGAIIAEASLSFLGLGVPPGIPSWGSMLSLEGRQYMQTDPALGLWPGLALSLAVYGINMFGDGLRDILDPKLRGGVGRYNLTEKKLEKVRAESENR